MPISEQLFDIFLCILAVSVAIALVIHIKGAKTREKIDKGFSLSYWNLSYRRKFILKYKDFSLVKDTLITLQDIISSQSKLQLTIDVDPEQDY